MTTYTVRTAEELEDTFKIAQGGDRIELEPGNYDTFRLWKRDFDGDGLTITSADPDNRAMLTDKVSIRETTGLTLTGLDFTAERVADSMSAALIDAYDNSHLTISDMVITGYIPQTGEGADPTGDAARRTEPIAGYGYGLGIKVKKADDVTISDIEFQDLRGALKIGKIDGVQINDLDIHDVREGINLFDVQHTVIEDSQFYDFKPWKTDGPQGDDHPDMIQYWGENSDIGIHDLTIRNNLFYQSPDDLPTQSIFGTLARAPDGATAKDFVITGNTIVNGRLNAIAIYDVTGLEISDNLVVPHQFDIADPDVNDTPRLVLINVRDAEIRDNFFLPIGVDRWVKWDAETRESGTVTFTGNTLLSTDPDDPLFWQPYATAIERPTVSNDGGDSPPPPPPPPPQDPDGPTDPGGADLSGMNAGDLARYEAEGAEIATGTNGNDLLRGQGVDTFLFGRGGSDDLKERLGNDVMHGGDGDDRFIIDLREGGPQSRDLILDLDFTEGDTISVISGVSGLFSDDADPENDFGLRSEGGTATFDSLADLAEAVASGAMTATTAADGDGLALVFASAPERVIELAGYAPGDIGSDDTPPPPPPDGPTGPGGADLSGMNAGDLARYEAEGAEIATGTNGNDLLRGQGVDTFLFGRGGSDDLKERLGNDVMHGGDGDDRFIIDLREGGPQSRDLILDLDFTEGDTISVISGVSGLFSDDADPENDFGLRSEGGTATFDSLADLAEAVASGAMTATTAADGDGLALVFASAPERVIELAGYAPGDIGSDDTPPPPPPDGPTGPGGADLSGMNAGDLARYEAEGAEVRTGTNGSDLIRGQGVDTFLFGRGGSDDLKERLGNDVMHGGDGDDRFIIDLREGGPQSRDLILDLDFTEGDTISVISGVSGLFSDDADRENDFDIRSEGGTATFDSLADLAEAVASGAMTATTAADGDGLALVFASAPEREIELAGYAPEDLIL